ncbi:nucleotidyltransferase family protein [Bordetella genomosp. 11]|uniref:Nitrate reductase n=1 Tax=Bordetella genomosp. 11 TaxID=1416808 RepID=A0A261UYB2_9BORD|nr:nucleotidyltransferase family protein [Bordetella genomosp. 11]OZI66888.1 hypothetical protein CAL28_03990 [Bordetella genomosp. 11]
MTPTGRSDDVYADRLKTILLNDPRRREVLLCVRALNLPDCWIGAGFVRNAIWNEREQRTAHHYPADVDVIWFDPERASAEFDSGIQDALRVMNPDIAWSVKNQARMHIRNGHDRYLSCAHAMEFWPETATAVAVRYAQSHEFEFLAPFGLSELFAGIVRPTPWARRDGAAAFDIRLREKKWLERWPSLRVLRD